MSVNPILRLGAALLVIWSVLRIVHVDAGAGERARRGASAFPFQVSFSIAFHSLKYVKKTSALSSTCQRSCIHHCSARLS